MIETFNSWQLSKKLLVAFVAIGVLLASTAAAGIIVMSRLGGIATSQVEQGIGGTRALSDILAALRDQRIVVWSHAYASQDEIKKYDDRYTASLADLDKAVKAYEPLADELMPQIKAVEAQIKALDGANQRILDARRRGDMAAVASLLKGETREESIKAIKGTEALVEEQQKRAEAKNAAGEAFAATAFWFVLALSFAALGILFGLWRLMGRTVATPLAEVASVTKRLAEGGKADVPHRDRADELGQMAQAVEQFRVAAIERAEADARSAKDQQVVTTSLRDSLEALTAGDLTRDIQVEFPHAYAELKTNFNSALQSLRALIGTVMESTASIQTGSNEIAQASEDLARRTEANAASLEETSAAITQMDQRLKTTATAAVQTVERADGAIGTVADGRGIADEAVQAMTRVSESAKGIDSVIEGLDKIAFQTRVLAMNAAVEAGRAGEAGRGFAVVADLVSALAMRSEEEAARARDQLTATQSDIITAVEMVQKVDVALADIAGGVGEVHSLLGQMASDNQAQSTAITQISVAIGTMDTSTQQNAAMVEQTSAAARNLTSEVSSLSEQASRFNVGGGRAPIAKAIPARPAKPAAARTKAPSAYVSPVKALPVTAMAGASDDDWTSF